MAKRKLGCGVALVGAGMSKFGAFPGKSSRDLFLEAYQEALASVERGLDVGAVEALYVGNFSSELFEGQGHLAPILAEWGGLRCPAMRVEGACASAGLALRQGILAIASGACDVVLAAGVEKMSDLPTERVTDTLATAGDTLYEIPAGFTFPGFYAAMATAYLHDSGASPETLMQVALKNHENGALNEKAQLGQRIAAIMEARRAGALKKGRPAPAWADEMEFLHDPAANPFIAWPLRLFDCSPVSDGAAALLLVREDLARDFCDNPLYVVGSGHASDGALHGRAALTSLPAVRDAAHQAYEMAGVAPADIDIAEVHDCFTIAEVLALEDLGFYAPGQAWKAVEEGGTARSGARPVNTSGGLKAKGHPVGASGIGQVVEIWKQLRGEAGARQVSGDLRLGLTHNVGGTGQTGVVHIFERR
jgi:acetyl-CoA acetyltransferase